MRYLALDLGSKYIGLAVSDESGLIARPLKVLKRRSRDEDLAAIQQTVRDLSVGTIIVGLPLLMSGAEGTQAAWVRSYSEDLAAKLDPPVPLILWDERLSTEDAVDIGRKLGRTPSKTWLDAVAAAVILQTYLDAQTSLGGKGPSIED